MEGRDAPKERVVPESSLLEEEGHRGNGGKERHDGRRLRGSRLLLRGDRGTNGSRGGRRHSHGRANHGDHCSGGRRWALDSRVRNGGLGKESVGRLDKETELGKVIVRDGSPNTLRELKVFCFRCEFWALVYTRQYTTHFEKQQSQH